MFDKSLRYSEVDHYWWSCLINHNTWLFPTLTAVDFSFSCIFSLQPAEFSIWTREAGAGGLAIAVEGPSRAEISFDDRKDGSCGVSYIAQEPGRANAHRWSLTGVSLWLSLSYVLAPPRLQVTTRSRWSSTTSTYPTAPTSCLSLLQRTTLAASLLPAFRWGMRRHLHNQPALPC